VAIAFADDVCLIAKSPDEAQVLLHHAQYYYVSASATLCAPKSVWTGTKTPDPWKIELRLHDQATALDSAIKVWRATAGSGGVGGQLHWALGTNHGLLMYTNAHLGWSHSRATTCS
jgi:hypothetical protein